MRLKFEADDLEILQGIVEESTEHLSGIEEGVLKLEADFAPEHLDYVFRALHSVKGVAGFVDYTPIKDTAHVLESFLSDMKKGLYIVNPEITDLLLRGIDILNLHVSQLGSHLQAFEGAGNNPIEIEIEEFDFDQFVHEAEGIRQNILNEDTDASRDEPDPTACTDPPPAKNAAARVMKLELASFLEQSRLDFIEEVYEHLDSIEKNCVHLEKDQANQDLLNAILRGFHSIKGGAGVILSMQEEQEEESSFNRIKNLTHAVESLLQTYRNLKMGIPAGIVDVILEAVDRSMALARAIESGQEESVTIEDLLQRLQVFSQNEPQVQVNEEPVVDIGSQIPKQLTAFANITRQALESLEMLLKTAKTNVPIDGKRVKQYIRALNSIAKSARQMEYADIVENVEDMIQKLKEEAEREGLVKEDLISYLRNMYGQLNGILDSRLKEIEQIYQPPEYCEKKLGEILLTENKISPEDLENALGEQRKLGEVLVDSGKVKKEDVDLALARQSVARSQGKETRESAVSGEAAGGQSIRVPQEKMNRLMNMIGELLISKNRIFHLADQINLEYEIPALARDVKLVAFDIARISDELQDAIMSARMLPLRILFQRYPRTIRDTARKVGKQADLIVEGEETELDKTVLEAINDPLVHMLRNAVDHGIEPPDVRRSLGKPEAGTVLLQARYQGNNVVIEIKDDGKGMNPEEIKAKALKKGLITADQIETLSLEDTFRLIFAPGFSTKEEVSELSGRGVGMDVVKNNIEKVGGSIHMTSAVNQGSHFTLKIPLSMSIIRGLMVRCGGQQFVVPLDCIEETVKIAPDVIRHYKDIQVADIRGGILHLIPLSEILGVKSNAADEALTNRVSVIVLEVDGNRFGLIVDSFHKEQEFVVKALDEDLARLKVYTGASILGDGNVVLILNPAQLFNLFLQSRKEGEAQWLQ